MRELFDSCRTVDSVNDTDANKNDEDRTNSRYISDPLASDDEEKGDDDDYT